MPIYQGIFTDKNGSRSIEMHNDFENFRIILDEFQFIGNDLDRLALVDESKENTALAYFDLEQITTNQSKGYDLELRNFQLCLQIPQTIIDVETHQEIEILMDFQFEIRDNYEEGIITFQINNEYFEGKNGLMENIMDQIQKQFRGKYRFKNCYGCLYGDYSVYGQSFIGSILCFKTQKKAYLKVKNKDDYMQLNIQNSPHQEIYCCEDYEIRGQSVGYRGTII